MDRSFVLPSFCSVNDGSVRREPPRTCRSRPAAAFALTKEAFLMLALLSSLGLWAAIWAAAGSFVSAWLR